MRAPQKPPWLYTDPSRKQLLVFPGLFPIFGSSSTEPLVFRHTTRGYKSNPLTLSRTTYVFGNDSAVFPIVPDGLHCAILRGHVHRRPAFFIARVNVFAMLFYLIEELRDVAIDHHRRQRQLCQASKGNCEHNSSVKDKSGIH